MADHHLSWTGSFIFSDMNVREYYHQALAEKGYRADQAQEQAIDRLQRYYDEWVEFRRMRSGALRRMFSRPEVPRGVYLWGGVGRGKSFLMDAFYLTVPLKRKTRIHFHEFMRGVHKELVIQKPNSNHALSTMNWMTIWTVGETNINMPTAWVRITKRNDFIN